MYLSTCCATIGFLTVSMGTYTENCTFVSLTMRAGSTLIIYRTLGSLCSHIINFTASRFCPMLRKFSLTP